jgi:hypothetical protein
MHVGDAVLDYAPPVQDIWMLTGADDDYGKK